jgi:hypothetical protein
VLEIIDTVFAKTSPKRSFSMTDYECIGLVFTKTLVYKLGHRDLFQGIDSVRLCGLPGRYVKYGCRTGPPGWESIPEKLPIK